MNKNKILILIYVDDILISSDSPKLIESTVQLLETNFKLKKLGFPTKFLGITIERTTNHSILLHQQDQVENILNEFEYDKDFHPTTPMREFKNIQIPSTEEITIYPYRTIIGKLLFLANMTRLDIAYAVGYLARHQITPQRIHHKMISHLLSYLACHKKLGLIYEKEQTVPPEL